MVLHLNTILILESQIANPSRDFQGTKVPLFDLSSQVSALTISLEESKAEIHSMEGRIRHLTNLVSDIQTNTDILKIPEKADYDFKKYLETVCWQRIQVNWQP